MRESEPMMVIAYVIASIMLGIIMVIVAIFLSSARAEASHGPAGQVITDYWGDPYSARVRSDNRVAAIVYSEEQSVFGRGATPIEYILQWPELPTVAEQAIRIARQRLSLFMAATANAKAERAALVDWKHTINAVGMACIAAGLMLLITVWPSKRDSDPGS